MKAKTISIEDKVDELLLVLDEDIRHIQQSLSRLNELRSLVIKRDDVSLGKLLETIRSESEGYRKHELHRQSIRKELADALGCGLGQMTLSTLEAGLPKEKKEQVTEKKAKLNSLIKELKKEHLSTALLLSECARFNKMLLESIFNFGNTRTVYYGSNGATKQQNDTAFVNLQF
ncbi:MAG: hypothetical protein GWN67_12645 [Phycisphaerae bacterium]|nr:hypothetical protein [Phycisphaerae bacterium]NIP52894.1 hypothetical protein [Phycisphaerae bacterium]NIS51945.1 hypothetical protein [Phycisphaerae bacterium]NIU09459.1 hypothetical protein [Phycisphaerae bacterium]NIU57192.1 hypothetical protein [Phycisphaerae bacterium]